jgi:uncharacterized membrane protein YeaQ/YmgE (transglycosylase-associated protein family)
MKYVWVTLYIAGWLATTFVLLRGSLGTDESGRRKRAAIGVVGAVCASALAAVWPISGWFLPMIRAALEDTD